MWVAIDIGATKTLIALFDESGNITKSSTEPTAKDYQLFIKNLGLSYKKILGEYKPKAAGVGVPGLIDRTLGKVIALGNLDWANKPIRDDISRALGGIPTVIENDARLAGLSEAQFLLSSHKSILYVTISTGIGGAYIENGQIVAAMQDTEMGKMPLQYKGELAAWEDFASGRAVVEKYGKKAEEIDDKKAWDEIGENIAYGLAVVCCVLQPEAIVFGGGVGQFSSKFSESVKRYLNHNLHSVVRQPELLAAKQPEQAVVYGCYLKVKATTV